MWKQITHSFYPAMRVVGRFKSWFLHQDLKDGKAKSIQPVQREPENSF